MHRTVLTAAVLAVAVAGCGGGASNAPPPASSALGNGSMTLLIPNRQTVSVRRPHFVSPSVVSGVLAVSGMASSVIDLSPASTRCTSASGGRTCTIPLSAPAGTPTFTLTLYDAPNGAGNVLGSATTTATVTPGSPFSLTFTVNGTVASVTVNVSGTFTPGVAGGGIVSVTVKDPGGNVITGPGQYSVPITITNSDTSGAFRLQATTITVPGSTVGISYSGALLGAVTIGAQAAGASSITPATLNVAAPTPAPSPSPVPSGGPTSLPSGSTPTPAPSGPAASSTPAATASATPSPSASPSPSPTPSPTPTPTPTPAFGPVVLSQSSLAFSFVTQTMTVTATQSGNSGNSFTASGVSCPLGGAGTIAQTSPGSFLVTAVSPSSGHTCTSTITGLGGQSAVLSMTF